MRNWLTAGVVVAIVLAVVSHSRKEAAARAREAAEKREVEEKAAPDAARQGGESQAAAQASPASAGGDYRFQPAAGRRPSAHDLAQQARDRQADPPVTAGDPSRQAQVDAARRDYESQSKAMREALRAQGRGLAGKAEDLARLGARGDTVRGCTYQDEDRRLSPRDTYIRLNLHYDCTFVDAAGSAYHRTLTVSGQLQFQGGRWELSADR